MQTFKDGQRVRLVNADRNAVIVRKVHNPSSDQEFEEAKKRHEEEYEYAFGGEEPDDDLRKEIIERCGPPPKMEGDIYLIRDEEDNKVYPAFESELGNIPSEIN